MNADGVDADEIKSKLDFMILDGGANVSVGQKQLINITRSAIQKPDIVMYNYAASAIDARRRAELWRILFQDLKGSTKFLATSEVETLKRLDHLILLHKGKVI